MLNELRTAASAVTGFTVNLKFGKCDKPVNSKKLLTCLWFLNCVSTVAFFDLVKPDFDTDLLTNIQKTYNKEV